MKQEFNIIREKINARATGFIRDGKDVFLFYYRSCIPMQAIILMVISNMIMELKQKQR